MSTPRKVETEALIFTKEKRDLFTTAAVSSSKGVPRSHSSKTKNNSTLNSRSKGRSQHEEGDYGHNVQLKRSSCHNIRVIVSDDEESLELNRNPKNRAHSKNSPNPKRKEVSNLRVNSDDDDEYVKLVSPSTLKSIQRRVLKRLQEERESLSSKPEPVKTTSGRPGKEQTPVRGPSTSSASPQKRFKITFTGKIKDNSRFKSKKSNPNSKTSKNKKSRSRSVREYIR